MHDKQRERLRDLWFVFGNHGPNHTPGNHKFVQALLTDERDLRDFYRPTQECLEAVEEVMGTRELHFSPQENGLWGYYIERVKLGFGFWKYGPFASFEEALQHYKNVQPKVRYYYTHEKPYTPEGVVCQRFLRVPFNHHSFRAWMEKYPNGTLKDDQTLLLKRGPKQLVYRFTSLEELCDTIRKVQIENDIGGWGNLGTHMIEIMEKAVTYPQVRKV
jgi:hypothetical protein